MSRHVHTGPGRTRSHTARERPSAPLRGGTPTAFPPPLPSHGGPAPLTQAPVVQLSLCSRRASRFARKQRRETGSHHRLASSAPRLGWGAVQGTPLVASAILSRRPQTSSTPSMPLAQHPIGGRTWSFHKTSLILFPLLKKRKKEKREEPRLLMTSLWAAQPLEHRPHTEGCRFDSRGVCLGGNQCFSLPSSLKKTSKQNPTGNILGWIK